MLAHDPRSNTLWRFALFYFCYYAAIGAYTPYVGRWVDAMGHGGFVVGAMLGLWYATRIVGPAAWAALAGRSARPGLWLEMIDAEQHDPQKHENPEKQH